ncbi:MAG: SpoIID/LytB domain-containing protein, partial [Candidatus Limnocylindrales bacterium]
MHRLLAVGALTLALIATATVLPPLVPRAAAASSCTGWKSSYTPPTTIRVLRSYGSASGSVQNVDFNAYVANVMAWEWPYTWPTNALRLGAIAVKQYGWYYTMHYRGGTSASGACYDVRDTTSDQIYRPETRSPYASEKAAIAATWPLSVRRTNNGLTGQFILTGYRSGSIWTCGAEQDGFRLFEKGVYDCARQGKTLEEIERIYYGSTLQPTDPGAHQIGDSMFGDAAAIVPTKTGVDAYVRTSTGSAFGSPAPTHINLADSSTLARVSADVNGDGLDDLVLLVADGPTLQ